MIFADLVIYAIKIINQLLHIVDDTAHVTMECHKVILNGNQVPGRILSY
jgi:hypothetical protein